MTHDTEAMRAQIRDLTERVEALEARKPQIMPAVVDGDAFWALEGLQERLDDNPATQQGAVMIVGSLTLPGGAPVSWQQAVGTEGLLEADWDAQAPVFAALGHPMRIALLRRILSGLTATADLAAIPEVGTSGQLHHHMRQLIAAGWVRHGGRGNYEIPPTRVVPLLACVMGAER